MTLKGALENQGGEGRCAQKVPFGASGEWTAWRSVLGCAARLLIDDVTEWNVARCEQKVGPRAITGGQPFFCYRYLEVFGEWGWRPPGEIFGRLASAVVGGFEGHEVT